MIEVSVMYADLTIQSQPLDDVHLLPKDNVLFILVKDTEVEGKLANISSSSGFDNYALLHRHQDSADWILLFGWDDGDYTWRRVPQCNGCQNRDVVDAPIGHMHTLFRGGAVDTGTWAEAVDKFNKDIA